MPIFDNEQYLKQGHEKFGGKYEYQRYQYHEKMVIQVLYTINFGLQPIKDGWSNPTKGKINRLEFSCWWKIIMTALWQENFFY